MTRYIAVAALAAIIWCAGCKEAEAVSWYFESDATLSNASFDPFPTPVVTVDAKSMVWGTTVPPSGASITDFSGDLVVCEDPVPFLALTHSNNPIETWWEPGDIGPGMNNPVALVDIDILLTLWEDSSKATQLLQENIAGTLNFFETHNDGVLDLDVGDGHVNESVPPGVDDLFVAQRQDRVSAVGTDGTVYEVTISGWYDNPALLGQVENFWSPEGGDNTGYLGVEVHAIPEPSILILSVLGLGLLLIRRRR